MSDDGIIDGLLKTEIRLKRLIEANQALAEIESLDALIPKLLDIAKSVTGSEAASLLLYDAREEVLKFSSIADEVVGNSGGSILKKDIILRVGEGISGWVAQNRKSLIVNDVQKDSRHFQQADQVSGFYTQNMLSVPLTYQDDLLGVINALNAKAKPYFDSADLELLESFAHLASIAIVRSRLLETKIQQQKFQVQLEAASKIQKLFLPRSPDTCPEANFWGVSIPAAFVGGDLYDIIPMPDGSWVVYVADVSDKGLAAALIMVALWSRIRAEAYLQENVSSLLEAVNNAMCELMGDEGFFATIILGRYWPKSGKMRLVRGGHIPPLMIRKNEAKYLQNLEGLALGVNPGCVYRKTELTLAPGESVVFLTDGVTEAENEKGELFGYNRLIPGLLEEPSPPRAKGLVQAVVDWRGHRAASDDLTILEIWR